MKKPRTIKGKEATGEESSILFCNKERGREEHKWLTPIIPATQKAEIKRTSV
jgi:hypothetical protein